MIHRQPERGSFAPSYLRGEPPSIGTAGTSEARESALSVNPSDGTFAPAYLKDQPYSVLREATGEPTAVARSIGAAKDAIQRAVESCIGAGVDIEPAFLDEVCRYLTAVQGLARYA